MIKIVEELCREVGDRIQAMIRSIDPEMKGSNDLVTSADRYAQEKLIEGLGQVLPGSSFLSEEMASFRLPDPDQAVWVIDPIDGTVNYAHQVPFYSISVALLRNGDPILGAVYAPPIQEFYGAEKGKGAFLNGRALDLSTAPAKPLDLIATSAGMMESDFVNRRSSFHAVLLPHYNRLRLMGSQALHLCFVAAGRLDAAVTNQAKLWDDAAGALILKESHGCYADFEGGVHFPLRHNSGLYKGISYSSVGARSQKSLHKIVSLLKSALQRELH